ncbi:ribosome biogenesis [Hyphodiscus hymeniophilus]|uniref:Ribosome biogenesis n=1 Tax=Hyphodiscus hymeniophilus TaxID=353542 RepID=A0A9P7AXT2_9HELO|nr:ribosome biogenesis [Hyphodiscus hymeniophilus]
MATGSTALTVKAENGSPYQLNSAQVLKASSALLKRIQTTEKASSSSKTNLLAAADDEEDQSSESTPIWLNLTTKKHIIDQKRLKPSKVTVPHALNTSPTTTICLITASPQRAYKDVVASPAFPASLGARITRVVDLEHLRKKWGQYENQRKLFSEHDVFLADDRIITMLAKALGKTFYKTQAKRPVPVNLAPAAKKEDGKTIKPDKSKKGEKSQGGNPGTAKEIAAEIEKALQSALVHLSPSTNTSVKVGYSSWDAQKLTENVEAVANGLIERFVPKKWRGVKSLHVKGESTAALPIWLSDEMWVEEGDVVEEGAITANTGKKRKLGNAEKVEEGVKKEKKQKLLESNDDNLDKEIKLRKEKLKKQKADAAVDDEDNVPKATKKPKKSKVKVDA